MMFIKEFAEFNVEQIKFIISILENVIVLKAITLFKVPALNAKLVKLMIAILKLVELLLVKVLMNFTAQLLVNAYVNLSMLELKECALIVLLVITMILILINAYVSQAINWSMASANLYALLIKHTQMENVNVIMVYHFTIINALLQDYVQSTVMPIEIVDVVFAMMGSQLSMELAVIINTAV